MFLHIPPFLLERIANQQKFCREMLRRARATHDIVAAAGACVAGQCCVESLPQGLVFPSWFECPLCFKVVAVNTHSEWETHVYEDLQPFTCTYELCDDLKQYKRKADWLRHENEMHRRSEFWICKQLSQSTRTTCLEEYSSKDKFELHLKETHKYGDERTKVAAREFQYKREGTQQLDLWVCKEPSVHTGLCLKEHFRKSHFELHLKRAHKISGDKVLVISQECHYIKAYLEKEVCTFCGESNFKNLMAYTNHLAAHLMNICLHVLPKHTPEQTTTALPGASTAIPGPALIQLAAAATALPGALIATPEAASIHPEQQQQHYLEQPKNMSVLSLLNPRY